MRDAVPQKVSVVVPTTGRAELKRAIASVRKQVTNAEIELILVVDKPEDSIVLPSDVVAAADQIRWTGGAKRGSLARNLGVMHSSGDWIAFLDDDDEWVVNKIQTQLDLAVPMAGSPDVRGVICSSRHVQVDAHGGRTSAPVPRRLRHENETVAEYLFRKRRPGGGRASMYTSTLMCSRQIAAEVEWDESLRRHQDWDWLIRASGLPGVKLIQAPTPLVRIHTGSAGSISASTSWQDSLAWADSALASKGSRVYADFVAAQSLRYAIADRSMTGVVVCLRRLLRNRRPPALGPLAIAAAGLIPRRLLERLMTIIR